MPDPTKMREEDRDEDKIFRDSKFLLGLEKDYCKPIKTGRVFTVNHIQYEGIGDEDKNLSVEEYIDTIGPCLSDVIDNHKTLGEWKIHSGNIITEHKT